jgi:hypothetical protein
MFPALYEDELFRRDPMVKYPFFRTDGTIAGNHLINSCSYREFHPLTVTTSVVCLHVFIAQIFKDKVVVKGSLHKSLNSNKLKVTNAFSKFAGICIFGGIIEGIRIGQFWKFYHDEAT